MRLSCDYHANIKKLIKSLYCQYYWLIKSKRPIFLRLFVIECNF